MNDITMLKEAVMQELGITTYEEISKIKKKLDAHFVTEQLIKLKKFQRSFIIRGCLWLTFSIIWLGFFLYEYSKFYAIQNVFFRAIMLLFLLSMSIAIGYDYGMMQKRQAVYRILKALGDASGSTEKHTGLE